MVPVDIALPKHGPRGINLSPCLYVQQSTYYRLQIAACVPTKPRVRLSSQDLSGQARMVTGEGARARGREPVHFDLLCPVRPRQTNQICCCWLRAIIFDQRACCSPFLVEARALTLLSRGVETISYMISKAKPVRSHLGLTAQTKWK